MLSGNDVNIGSVECELLREQVPSPGTYVYSVLSWNSCEIVIFITVKDKLHFGSSVNVS